MSKKELRARKLKDKAVAYDLKVFTYIQETYMETQSSSTCVSYDSFYRSLGRKNSDTSSVGKVFVSPSDFLADVALTVKRVSTRQEYDLFLAGECPDDIKAKIGRAFIQRGLHPLSKYLQPIALEITNTRDRV